MEQRSLTSGMVISIDPRWVFELTRWALKYTHICCSLFALVASLFFAQTVHAQTTTPDFSKVDDILRGKRTLLQITDLQV